MPTPDFLLPRSRRILSLLLGCATAITLFLEWPVHGQGVDANTTLLLRFEGSLNGEQGESPASASGHSFQAGLQGQAVSLPAGNQLFYPAANNISGQEGTIEFWIKPSWNGNDSLTHTILDWGGSGVGGMRIDKHGANNLAIVLDTFGGWHTAEVSASSWAPDQWHYISITYSNTSKKIQIYIDGIKKAERTFSGVLPVINHANFQIGGAPGSANPVNALLDEFRISNRVRTEQEIVQRYLAPLTVTSLSYSTVTTKLWPTWRIPVTFTGNTNVGNIGVPASAITWSSTPQNIASINSTSQIAAQAPGNTTITGMLNGAQVNIPVTVNTPAKAPKIVTNTGFRATPAVGHLYEIPVVSLRYIPTANGVDVDTSWAPGYWGLEPITVATLEQNLDHYDEIRKFMLEEGSRFRDYGGHTVPPSLGYRIVATITVYEPSPPGRINVVANGYPLFQSEYIQMFERWNVRDYVEGQGVKELWYWTGQLESGIPAYNPAIHLPENFRSIPESNMASPVTGDVSNSNRDPSDLPVYDSTYIVYHQGMRRLDTLTLHIDGHQWEHMLLHVNNLQDGNDHLFWRKFVGYDSSNVFRRGRAGWTHQYPNNVETADGSYDYHNLEPVATNIKDWNPDGSGQTIQFSATTLQNTPYVFPNNYLDSLNVGGTTPMAEPHWYIFWRQSIPGWNNSIPYETNSVSHDDDNDGSLSRISDSFDQICFLEGDGFRTVRVARPETNNGFRQQSDTKVQHLSNGISSSPSVANRMTNWWHFNGDWDRAIRSGVRLYEPASCSYTLSSSQQSFTANGGSGAVTVTAGAGCKWFASNNATWTPLVSGDIGNGNGTVNFSVGPNLNPGIRTTKIIVAGQPFTVTQEGSRPVLFDYDGDRKSDLSVQRPSDNVWYLLRATAGYTAMQFGVPGDRMTPADYDGDGKTDVSVFRPSNGTWYMYMSGTLTFQEFGWGQNGDLPVPTDRDADGKTDLVIFRPSDNTWYTRFANGTFHTFVFGVAGDKPVVGDFDGDGVGDIALFRPSNNNWYIIKSSLGFFIQTWGVAGDLPLTGDFDGDGATDQAVFRPSTGEWYLSQTTAGFSVRNWGQNGDIPVAADYDGDGTTDVAVFRPSENNWYIVNSTAGIQIQQFGETGDVPTQSAFLY